MSEWYAVATVSDMTLRKKKAVDVAGTAVALFFVKGTVYALNDICMHEQRQLSKGALLFGKIICPGHQWKFDPASGEPEDQDGCQPTHAVKIDDDGTIYVSLSRVKASA
jgi:nitrite reductase (NADH) small subunit